MSTVLIVILAAVGLLGVYTLGFVNGVQACGLQFKALLSNEQLLLDLDKLEAAQAKVSANGRKR